LSKSENLHIRKLEMDDPQRSSIERNKKGRGLQQHIHGLMGKKMI
jgi:hypothetical protein